MPDMEPDPVIEEAAAAHRVHVLWGLTSWSRTSRGGPGPAHLLPAHGQGHPGGGGADDARSGGVPGHTRHTRDSHRRSDAQVLIEKVEIHIHAGGVTGRRDALGQVLDRISPEQD